MMEFSRTSGIHGTRAVPARRETVRRAAAALVLLAVCGLAQAQPEPRVPCIDCPERVFSPRPETGLWNNPLDPTGTGFMLGVQGERVAGFHFGYDDAGEPVWFLIAGTLEMPADAPAVRYRIFPVAGFCPPDNPCVGTPPPPPSIGVFECVGTENFGPLCTLELDSQAGMLTFTARLGDISDSRWIAENGERRDVQAFRVDYD